MDTTPPLDRASLGGANSLKSVLKPDVEVSLAAPLRVRSIIVYV